MSEVKIKGKDFDEFRREFCMSNGRYLFADVLKVSEVERGIRVQAQLDDGCIFYAKTSMGHCCEVDLQRDMRGMCEDHFFKGHTLLDQIELNKLMEEKYGYHQHY